MDSRHMESFLAENSFFKGLAPAYLALVAKCTTAMRFEAEEYLFRQNDPADRFYVVRQGRVAIEISTPHLGPISIQTLDEGDVVGWSWLFPPHEWNFDARAILTTRVLAIDGRALREACDNEPAFGYEMMKRCSAVMCERLQATRLQLLDMYRAPAG